MSLVAVATLLLATTACGGDGEEGAGGGGLPSDRTMIDDDFAAAPLDDLDEFGVMLSPPTLNMVTVMDPVNNAFTVQVPEEWDNLVYSVLDGEIYRGVVNSMSPDGQTVLFVGDPRLPNYWNPDTANPITIANAEQSDMIELAYYDPAPQYFDAYITRKFGHLDDFSIIAAEQNPLVESRVYETHANVGLYLTQVDAVDIRFTYTDEAGNASDAIMTGVTLGMTEFWQADVWGVSTTGSADDYVDMLWTMATSKETNPAFAAEQQRKHEMEMEQHRQIQRGIQDNMARMQASSNAHQQRMQSIWAANDANVSGFLDRMNSSDVQHRSFLNYINEENTVTTSGGNRMQVDNSYDRYWVNKYDGSYVGGDINFGGSSLSDLGLNPGDYEEATIVN